MLPPPSPSQTGVLPLARTEAKGEADTLLRRSAGGHTGQHSDRQQGHWPRAEAVLPGLLLPGSATRTTFAGQVSGAPCSVRTEVWAAVCSPGLRHWVPHSLIHTLSHDDFAFGALTHEGGGVHRARGGHRAVGPTRPL